MLALLQRVAHAQVIVENHPLAKIGQGILAFVAYQPEDNTSLNAKMLSKSVSYRIFGDKHDKMNLSLDEIEGELLLVPQFTLAAATNKGLRPSFSSAAKPAMGEALFNDFYQKAKQRLTNKRLQKGQFSAHMQVELLNDGPATFLLQF